jgi:hypothetical protein
MQTTSNNTNGFLRNSILLTFCFAMFFSASSASFFSGGGKKGETKKTTTLNLRAKTPLSLTNGFKYRAGLSFSTNSSNHSHVLNNRYIRYQRGNNIYVLPVKQKAVMKFKTPQKEIK